jgi:hypothetical protein
LGYAIPSLLGLWQERRAARDHRGTNGATQNAETGDRRPHGNPGSARTSRWGTITPWGHAGTDLLATLQELEHLGVGFVSLTEALDLTTPAGRAMAGLLVVLAEFDREILRERVRASLAHARQNGQRLGRPITAALHADQVRKFYRAGISKSEIAGCKSAGPRFGGSWRTKIDDCLA